LRQTLNLSLSLLFLLLAGFSFAQDTLTGFVTTGLRDKPLPDASVHIEGTTIGTVTDRYGRYRLVVEETQVTLAVSYIGYETKRIPLDLSEKNERLTIRLEEKVNTLAPVAVSSSRIELAHNAPKYWVIDYELQENRIVLLLASGRKSILRLSNFYSETQDEMELEGFKYSRGLVNFREDLSKREHYLKESKHIYKDYKGDIHLISGEQFNELYFKDDSIFMFADGTLSQLEKFVLPISYSVNNCLYWQEISDHNQRIRYVCTDTTTGATTYCEVFDQVDARTAQHWYVRSYFPKPNDAGIMGEIAVEQLYDERVKFQATGFYRSLLSKPEYAPLLLVRDTFYLLDHINGRLLVLDQHLNIQSEIDIYYHHQKEWHKQVHVDDATGKVYLEFMMGGLKELRELNLTTGEVVARHRLEEQTFPEKVRVFDGYAYYMYRGKSDATKRYLYKQRL